MAFNFLVWFEWIVAFIDCRHLWRIVAKLTVSIKKHGSSSCCVASREAWRGGWERSRMTWRSEALCTASGRTEKIRSDDSAHISCFTNHTSAQVNSGVVSWFASCFASRCRPVVVASIASSPPPTWNRYKKRPHLHHHFFLHRDRQLSSRSEFDQVCECGSEAVETYRASV